MFFFKKQTKFDTANLKVPHHVAIIMDGNFRWAKAHNLPANMGHKKGVNNIEIIVDACIDFGIKYLTLYAFSSENWDRPVDEVSYLMKLLDEYLDKETQKLHDKGVKILVSGDLTKLPEKTRQKITKIENETKNNNYLVLNVAFSYGARQEIVSAVKKIISMPNIDISDINDQMISQNLYQPQIPDPCLLIRTAGDLRISNFLLWQIAYSELYFVDILWPDFSKKDLHQAIINFNQRERRYGKR